MYSIVLATMLTTGAATPDWGCRGCCGGCCGGCWGCHGCWGCCGGCWGCHGCWGGCYGCYGCCGGCYGCCGGCWGCWGCWGGCYGCYGGGWAVPVAVAPVATVPAAPVLPAQPKKDEKKASLGNAAEVIVKAPLGVQLSVEDQSITRTAGEEAFRTPALEPGYSYTYTFKAAVVRNGKTTVYSKQVKVQAGESSVADFTRLIAAGKDAARVTVKLPADAQLYVEGVLCPLTTATRAFDTPELTAGQRYYYTLKAEVVRDGEKKAARKRVLVEAGKEITVEFKDLPVRTVSR